MRRFKHIYHLVLFGEASLNISSFTIKIYRKDSFSALRSRIVKNTRIEMSLNFLYVIINVILYLIYKKYQIKSSGLYLGYLKLLKYTKFCYIFGSLQIGKMDSFENQKNDHKDSIIMWIEFRRPYMITFLCYFLLRNSTTLHFILTLWRHNGNSDLPYSSKIV